MKHSNMRETYTNWTSRSETEWDASSSYTALFGYYDAAPWRLLHAHKVCLLVTVAKLRNHAVLSQLVWLSSFDMVTWPLLCMLGLLTWCTSIESDCYRVLYYIYLLGWWSEICWVLAPSSVSTNKQKSLCISAFSSGVLWGNEHVTILESFSLLAFLRANLFY